MKHKPFILVSEGYFIGKAIVHGFPIK